MIILFQNCKVPRYTQFLILALCCKLSLCYLLSIIIIYIVHFRNCSESCVGRFVYVVCCLLLMAFSFYQVTPQQSDGRALGEQSYVRTGLLGFLGPVCTEITFPNIYSPDDAIYIVCLVWVRLSVAQLNPIKIEAWNL